MNINEIEALHEDTLRSGEYAYKSMNIKGFTVYFCHFGENFGYSYAVFKNGHHISYANDYELHHRNQFDSYEELEAYYVKSLNRKLFTDDEIGAPISDYGDYRNRDYFLRNYYPLQFDHESAWFIGSDEEREKRDERIKSMYYCKSAFTYFNDLDTVLHLEALMEQLEKAKCATMSDYEYLKKALRYEFSNYECIYGGRYAEAASNVMTGELTDVQKRAFRDAKREYEKWCYAHDLP